MAAVLTRLRGLQELRFERLFMLVLPAGLRIYLLEPHA